MAASKRPGHGLILSVVAMVAGFSLDRLQALSPLLPIHLISFGLAYAGLSAACWLGARHIRSHSSWPPLAWRAAAAFPLLVLAAYLLWTPAVLLDVPKAPLPFTSGGKRHIAYEIRARHYGLRAARVQSAAIFSADGERLRNFDADWLSRGPWEDPDDPIPAVRLAPGRTSRLYLWVALEKDAPVPYRLTHRLNLEGGDSLAGAATPVRRDRSLPVLSPPLRGGPWMASAGPSNWSRHRRAAVLGHIAQRFAVDWVLLDEQGRLGLDALRENSDYYGFGRPVLAVAQGRVVEAMEGRTDNTPGQLAQPPDHSNFTGNMVVLDLGGNTCAFYAHLREGSVRVRRGQLVSAGEVLGELGNSGNSDRPHLHFHVTEGCDTLLSEGIPYLHERYLSHAYHTYSPGYRVPEPREVEYSLPLRGEVVTFPE